jgi:hypothetical protein
MYQEGVLMLAIANHRVELSVEAGREAEFRLTHETWPKPWPDETPMMLVCQPALLRVPVFADGDEIVIQLNAADTVWPQPAVAFCVTAFHDGRMHRILSGTLRRS